MTPVERPQPTCDNCFFRRAGLCALPGNTPCPTFRAADGGHARKLERQRAEKLQPVALRAPAAA